MPFDKAIDYLTKYMKTKAERLHALGRPVWFATPAGSLPKLAALFDTATENTEWGKLTEKSMGDKNLVIGVRNRIAWLCGCRSDVRRQCMADRSNALRDSVHVQRFAYGQSRLNAKVLERLKELQLVERKKPITGAK